MLTKKSHRVEISIAGAVADMLHDPNPESLFFETFSFFLFCALFYYLPRLLGTNRRWCASYGKEKPL